MASAPPRSGPVVRDDAITFRFHDPDRAYAAVGLMQELRRPRDWMPLTRAEGGDVWSVDFPRMPVDRMEYQLKLVHPDGAERVVCDPANPLRAPGAFGEKSVVELPGYSPPAWLRTEVRGELFSTSIASQTLATDLPVDVWTSAGADVEEPLPALVVHDGPEYAAFADVQRYATSLVCSGRVPPLRLILLPPPPPRDEHYSASARYARSLVTEVLPALEWLAPMPRGAAPVGLGASLGALALLHAHRLRPPSFGALFLQSGSFFRQRYDRQEADFPRFRRITRFVGDILNTDTFDHPVAVHLTCGVLEENLANNTALFDALRRQGYAAAMTVHRDAHNYVAWRDALDPELGDLLAAVWHAS